MNVKILRCLLFNHMNIWEIEILNPAILPSNHRIPANWIQYIVPKIIFTFLPQFPFHIQKESKRKKILASLMKIRKLYGISMIFSINSLLDLSFLYMLLYSKKILLFLFIPKEFFFLIRKNPFWTYRKSRKMLEVSFGKRMKLNKRNGMNKKTR